MSNEVRAKVARRLCHARHRRHFPSRGESAQRHSNTELRHGLYRCVTLPNEPACRCTFLHRRRRRVTRMSLVTVLPDIGRFNTSRRN